MGETNQGAKLMFYFLFFCIEDKKKITDKGFGLKKVLRNKNPVTAGKAVLQRMTKR